MALDLEKTFAQIQAAARHASGNRDDAARRLATLVETTFRSDVVDIIEAKANTSQGVYAFLPAAPMEPPNAKYEEPPLPEDFCVVATDGSHIATDRHLPLRCYLINLGHCLLINSSPSFDCRITSP